MYISLYERERESYGEGEWEKRIFIKWFGTRVDIFWKIFFSGRKGKFWRGKEGKQDYDDFF